MTDDASPEAAAAEALGGALTDRVEIAERLPVPPGQAEAVARILDRLSEGIGEAAGMLRSSDASMLLGGDDAPPSAAAPGHASCDPWSIVDLVTHDLSRRGIKSWFGSEVDLGTAAQSAGQLLEALGVRPVAPDDDEPAVPGPVER